MPDNQELTSKELLDCPFCDASDVRITSYCDDRDATRYWYVLCHVCCGRSGETTQKELVAKDWNVRTYTKQLTTTQQALDEADRRAGAAERELSRRIKELCNIDACRRKYKEQAGYPENTSFDLVWEEVLKKSKQAPEQIQQALDRAVEALEICLKTLTHQDIGTTRMDDGYLYKAFDNAINIAKAALASIKE